MDRYAGARGRLDIARVSRLSARRYCLQPKLDGCYAEVECDSAGVVVAVRSRTGRELPEGRELLGIRAMPSACILAGELEAHTEAGVRAAAERGHRLVHLFDVVARPDRTVADLSYAQRRDMLWRGQSTLAGDVSELSSRRDRWGMYHDRHGKFCPTPTPLDWRRFPIVPSLPVSAADELWDQARADALEGFVVVDIEAPLGRRNAKRKVKPIDHLDCVVVRAEPTVARLRTFGREFLVSCKGLELLPGDCVSVSHNGWYSSGEPRFPRVERKRTDWQSPRKLSSSALSTAPMARS